MTMNPQPTQILTAVAAAFLLGLPIVAAVATTAPATPAPAAFEPLALVGLPAADSVSNDGIGPGAQILIRHEAGGSFFLCTANWAWKDQAGGVHLGTAGHCLLPGGTTSTHGSDADFDASAVEVYVCRSTCYLGGQSGGLVGLADASAPESRVGPRVPGVGDWVQLGPVSYARQNLAGAGPGNDFGLVAVPASLLADVDPALPFWGGPVAAATTVADGDFAVVHGNGALLAETAATKSRAGAFTFYGAERWMADLPVAGGDSGSPVGHVVAAGTDTDFADLRAAGIVTHGGGCLGTHSSNGADVYCGAVGTTLARAVAMAQEAGLCIAVLLDGQDAATAPAAPDCFA